MASTFFQVEEVIYNLISVIQRIPHQTAIAFGIIRHFLCQLTTTSMYGAREGYYGISTVIF